MKHIQKGNLCNYISLYICGDNIVYLHANNALNVLTFLFDLRTCKYTNTNNEVASVGKDCPYL